MTARTIEEDLFGSGYQQPINQKLKGNKNELRACKSLSRWTGSEFVRIPGSGSLRWQNVMNICGDVLSTDPSFYFPFVVETKDLTKVHITKQLRKNSFIYTIWEQVFRDSVRAARHPMLLLRKTGERPVDKYTIYLEDFSALRKLLNIHNVNIISEGFILIGMDSLKLFSHVNYKSFIKAYHEYPKGDPRGVPIQG